MGRLTNIFRFGRLKKHGNSGEIQVENLSGETHSSVPHPQIHGIESKAPVGSETYTVYMDGNPDQGATLVVAGQAPITLADGDTVVYSAGGATVHCTGSKIELNGSAFGGLIKIDDLTTKINALVTVFNGHTHAGVTPGGSNTSTPSASQTPLNKSDYENTDVNHG